jgi:hypothetical protein
MPSTPTIRGVADAAGRVRAGAAQPNCAQDERDEDEQRPDVGRDVADVEPGGLDVVRIVLLRLGPLGADSHQQVGGEDAQHERLQGVAREAGSALRRAPAEDGHEGYREEGADEQHRAEDVDEERQVDRVGANRGKHLRLPASRS